MDDLKIASSLDGQGSLVASTMVLAHVSINVSGSGIANTVVYTWDNCHDCSVPTSVPASFQVTVPSGTGRLIQILAVYQDSATNQMIFYYGDLTKDLTAATDTAEINVAKVGTGNITSGRVAGRYFNTATSGPTGLIDIKYNPGNGKLPLIVENAVIVNGWFSMLMLSGANLVYSVRGTEEILWGQEVSFESAAMDPAENSGAYFDQRLRAFIPVHIEKREESGTIAYKVQDAETFVWGYWGPGAVGKKVCTSGIDGSPVPQRLKQYKTGDLTTASPLSVSHYINWNLAVPTRAVLTDTVAPYSYVVFQGGASMSSGCVSFADDFANQFTNFQKITLNQVDGNGGDSVAGFTGIFRNDSNNNFTNVSSADPKVISGNLLPGVEDVFSGLRLFKRVSSEDYRLEVPKCNELAGLGFTPASSTDVSIAAGGNISLPSNITAAEGASGVTAVICPVKNGALAPLGIFMGKWNFNMGVDHGGGSATQIALVTPQKSVTTGALLNNLCTPVELEARTANGDLGYLPGPVTVNLTSSDANVRFYTYSACAGSVTSVQANAQRTTIYINRGIAGTASANITASTVGYGGNTANISFTDAPGSITPKITINAPTTINAYECYPVKFESWNSNLYMVNFYDTYATTFNLPMVTASGLGFYYTGDCSSSSPLSSVSLGSSPQQIAYLKYTGSATNLDIQPTSISPASPILTSDFVGGNGINVIQPGAATNLDLMMSLSFPAAQCQTVQIRSTDANGRTAPSTSALTLDLTSTVSGGTFYQYGGCTGPISSLNFAVGTLMETVYFKANSTGTGAVTASSVSPSISTTRSVMVTPEVYSQMFVALPGQTYSPGSGILGTPAYIPQSQASYAQIYLVKSDGQIDTNANGTLLTNGSISGGTMQVPTTVNFASGVGFISFMPDNSYTTMYLSLYSNSLFYNGPALQPFLPATMMNVYMSNQNALAPGGCQIFAVIAESLDGPSTFFMPSSFSITADNGGTVYTDASCASPVSGSYTFYQSDRIKAFYFKQPANTTTSSITVSPLSGGITSTPITVGTDSTPTGSASTYLFTGSSASMRAPVCQAYLVSVSDAQGRSVVIGTDQAITAWSAPYGTIYENCDGGMAPTSILSAINFTTVYLKNMISGLPHYIHVTGSPLAPGDSATFTPNP